LFVLLLFTIVHVVAAAPAAGAVDQVVGVVTSQPMNSFTDVAVSSMALFVLGSSASDVGPVFSLLIALVVFVVGAYRARRLASADHDGSSSDSTQPCSPAPSPEPVEALEYSPVSDTPWYWDDPPGSPSSDDECSSMVGPTTSVSDNDSDDEQVTEHTGYRTYWISSQGEETVTVPAPRSLRYIRRSGHSDQRGSVIFGLMGLRSGSACDQRSGSPSPTPIQR
jgi:hypothetical protein